MSAPETRPVVVRRRWRGPLGRLLHRFGISENDRFGDEILLACAGLIGAIIAGLLTLLIAETYEAVAEADGVSMIDRPVLDFMIRHRTPDLNRWVTVFTNIGGPIVTPIILVVAAVVFALRRRSWTPVTLIGVAGLGVLALTTVGKLWVGRIRPDHALAVPPYEASPSFPSGHSSSSVVAAGIIAYVALLKHRRTPLRWIHVSLAALYALAMGTSRIYLGHHWTTDVMTGWLLGAAWLTACITAHKLIVTTRARRRAVRRAHALALEDDPDQAVTEPTKWTT